MPLFGPKTGFRARMNEMKSGIQCSAVIRCVALGWLIDDAFVFVKSWQAVYKTHNTVIRCVALGWLLDDAFVFVKSWQAVYKYKSMGCDVLGFLGCYELL
jgi:hypothetical protein